MPPNRRLSAQLCRLVHFLLVFSTLCSIYARIMAFRISDEIEQGLKRATQHLIDPLPPSLRGDAKTALLKLVKQFGPVVDRYPAWHPFLAGYFHPPYRSRWLPSTPQNDCGFVGLNNCIFLRDAIILSHNGEICSMEKYFSSKTVSFINDWVSPYARVECLPVDAPLYSEKATTVAFICSWKDGVLKDGTIAPRNATALFLKAFCESATESTRPEEWKDILGYVIGGPCGNRSSLFVNQATGQGLKNLLLQLNKSGLFGSRAK